MNINLYLQDIPQEKEKKGFGIILYIRAQLYDNGESIRYYKSLFFFFFCFLFQNPTPGDLSLSIFLVEYILRSLEPA